jgi:hypothetical protein
MPQVFAGHLQVTTGRLFPAENGGLGLEESFQGQSNGLCGAACSGMLFLITGLHTGHVGFTVDVLDARPARAVSFVWFFQCRSPRPVNTSVRLPGPEVY